MSDVVEPGPEQLLEEAKTLQGAGEHGRAAELLLRVVEAGGGDWEARFRCANSLAMDAQVEKAYELWREVVASPQWNPASLQGPLAGQFTEAMRHVSFETTVDADDPKSAYLQAQIAQLFNQPDVVKHALTKTLTRQHDYEDTLEWLMRLYQESGQHEEALKLIEPLLMRDPQSPGLNYWAGELNFQTQRTAVAVRILANAAKLDPGRWQIHARLAQIYTSQHRFEEADAAYEAALGLNPDDFTLVMGSLEAAKRMYQFDRALALLEKAAQLKPDDLQVRVELAQLSFQMGAMDKAVPGLEAALAASPEDPQLQVQLARAYHATGQHEKAVPLLQKALGHTPDGELAFLLARSLSELKHRSQAFEALKKAVELNPDRAQYQAALGKELMALGQVDAAMKALVAAADLEPSNAVSQLNVAGLYKKAGQTRTAMDYYMRASAAEPERVDVHLQVGILGLTCERLEEAANAFIEVLRLSPTPHPMALAGVAQIYQRRGLTEVAVDFYRQALQANPGLGAAAQAVSVIFAKDKDIDGLLSFLRDVLGPMKGRPEDARTLVHGFSSYLESKGLLGFSCEIAALLAELFPGAEAQAERSRLFLARADQLQSKGDAVRAYHVLHRLHGFEPRPELAARLEAMRTALGAAVETRPEPSEPSAEMPAVPSKSVPVVDDIFAPATPKPEVSPAAVEHRSVPEPAPEPEAQPATATAVETGEPVSIVAPAPEPLHGPVPGAVSKPESIAEPNSVAAPSGSAPAPAPLAEPASVSAPVPEPDAAPQPEPIDEPVDAPVPAALAEPASISAPLPEPEPLDEPVTEAAREPEPGDEPVSILTSAPEPDAATVTVAAPQSEPIDEPKSEAARELQTGVEAVSSPAGAPEPITEPLTESAPEPEPGDEPVSNITSAPELDAVTVTVAAPQAEPIDEPMSEAARELQTGVEAVSAPAGALEPLTEPVTEAGPEPGDQPVGNITSAPEPDAVTVTVAAPQSEPIDESLSEAAPEPEPGDQPVSIVPAPEPDAVTVTVAAPQAEPIDEPMSEAARELQTGVEAVSVPAGAPEPITEAVTEAGPEPGDQPVGNITSAPEPIAEPTEAPGPDDVLESVPTAEHESAATPEPESAVEAAYPAAPDSALALETEPIGETPATDPANVAASEAASGPVHGAICEPEHQARPRTATAPAPEPEVEPENVTIPDQIVEPAHLAVAEPESVTEHSAAKLTVEAEAAAEPEIPREAGTVADPTPETVVEPESVTTPELESVPPPAHLAFPGPTAVSETAELTAAGPEPESVSVGAAEPEPLSELSRGAESEPVNEQLPASTSEPVAKPASHPAPAAPPEGKVAPYDHGQVEADSSTLAAPAPSRFVRERLFELRAHAHRPTQQHLWERSLGEYLLASSASRAFKQPRDLDEEAADELCSIYLDTAKILRDAGWLEQSCTALSTALLYNPRHDGVLDELEETVLEWVEFLDGEEAYEQALMLLEGQWERRPNDGLRSRARALFGSWADSLRQEGDHYGAEALEAHWSARKQYWDQLKTEWATRSENPTPPNWA